MYIGLSTCPHHASGNVGDQLITDAAIRLFEEEAEDFQVKIFFRKEDLTSRLDLVNSSDGILLFGFPVVENNIIPKMYRFVEDLEMLEVPIIPVGGIFNFFPGKKALLRFKSLNNSSKEFIDRIVPNCPNEKIPVRTDWVGKFLELQGYDTVLTGDPAWYDPEYIGNSFHKPESIDQLVFTPPHKQLYESQAKKLIKQLGDMFSGARRIISFQSALLDLDRRIRDYAQNLGWKIKYTSHDTSNIEFYRESDLHVGYRKHGHLAHLRWRIPSMVIAEDSRAMGLTDTLGTAGVPGYKPRFPLKFTPVIDRVSKTKPAKGVEFILKHSPLRKHLPLGRAKLGKANPNAVDEVIKFLKSEMDSDWSSYQKIKEKIDTTYQKGMKPYIKSVLEENQE